MSYLLYLKRSLLRRPRAHMTLFAVLTCAFLLPLLISIYRDSSDYGLRQELIERSKGYAYHVQNVSESDTQYFYGINGLSEPKYENGTIYLNIASDTDWQSVEAAPTYENFLMKRIEEYKEATGNERIIVTAYSYEEAHGIITDPAHISGQRILLVVNLCIILISVLIVHSAYQGHLRRFAHDIGTLFSCGADRRQIRRIFLVEFLIMFLLSSVSAVVISVGTAKLLFSVFLEIRDIQGLAWLIFHVDVWNTLLHLAVFFAALLVILLYTLRQNEKQSIWGILRSDNSGDPVKRYSKRMEITEVPSRSLAKLWRQRTGRIPRSCTWVCVPMMVIFLFLFNYLMTNLSVTRSAPDYAFTLEKSGMTIDGFSEAEIQSAEFLEGVASVERIHTTAGMYYIGSFEESVLGEQAGILPYSGDLSLASDEIAISKKWGYIVGDVIELCSFSEETGAEETVASLTVAQLLDADDSSWETNLYCSEALYDALMAEAPISQLRVALNDVSYYEQVRNHLSQHFFGAEYNITDHQAKALLMAGASTGYFALLLYIFCILFLFTLVIVYVRLSDYIESRKGYIRTLSTLGAPKKSIYRSYIRQIGGNASFAAFAPVLLCIPLILLALIPAGVMPVINQTVIFVHAVVIAAIWAAYVLPTHGTLNKLLRKL